jgi:hypothetical protein
MKQRKLTQEELDKAPAGFNHYAFMVVSNTVAYIDFDNSKMITIAMLERGESPISSGSFFSESEIQPIPSKAFGLSKVEWSDDDIARVRICDNRAYIDDADYDITSVSFNKKELIVLAKALDVKAEDL